MGVEGRRMERGRVGVKGVVNDVILDRVRH